jgi:glycolate oxidase iron-sulfur subunit
VSDLDLDAAASARLDDLIDSCVSCGFCLAACPTFHLTGEESESPRGRIELVAALQADELPLGDVRPHLDRCLGCRACEPACPSNVQYGEILELARGGGAVTRTRTVDATLAAVRHPGLIGAFVRAGRPFARLVPGALGAMGRATERPHRIDWERRRPGAPRAAVLRGCVMQHAFAPAQQAAVDLLSICGYDVVAAPGQGCCGALHLHNGELAQGERMRAATLAAFPADTLIVSTSAGCGAALREHAPERVLDLTEAVARAPEPPRFRRRAWRLAVFDPCHLRHAQGIVDEPRLLAGQIAREVVELRDAGRCCGAAGVYALEQPELSALLRADRVAAIGESAADAVLCGNPGCALQLRQGLAEAGLSSVRVLHPAELAVAAARERSGSHGTIGSNM